MVFKRAKDKRVIHINNMIDEEIKQQELQEAYDEIYNKVMEMIILKKYEPQMIAGTLMAQALKIYKTTLLETDYLKMIEAITESAEKVPSMIDKRKLN